MERRLHSRHNAQTTVYIQVPGRSGKVCRARNLSANGAFVDTENLGLKKGTLVEVAFAVTEGRITRIHRRTAVVAHVTQGGTGLRMESLAGR
jgi:PilZ domain